MFYYNSIQYMDQNLINSNNNSNNCSNNLVNTINQRILARTMTTGNVEVLLPSRPQQTLYTMPLANAVPHGECKPRVLKYNSEPNSYFLPATSNKSWSNYAANTNTESILRNQVYALQKAPQAQYVPNSTSDLYNSTITKTETSTAQGLYPNLPNSNSDNNNNIWGLQPTLHPREKNSSFSQHTNLGTKIFNNDTRQLLKDN